MARNEDCASLAREPLQEVPHPTNAVGIEPVHRLIEEEHLGITEERCGDAEPLPHAERVLAGSLSGDRGEAHRVENLVDSAQRDAVRLGEHAKVGAGTAARVDRLCFQKGADLVQRPRKVVIVTSVHGDVAGVRRVETHDHPHRRRLAGSVRAEEPRHDTRPYLKAELIDGHLGPVPLGQGLGFDHRRLRIICCALLGRNRRTKRSTRTMVARMMLPVVTPRAICGVPLRL